MNREWNAMLSSHNSRVNETCVMPSQKYTRPKLHKSAKVSSLLQKRRFQQPHFWGALSADPGPIAPIWVEVTIALRSDVFRDCAQLELDTLWMGAQQTGDEVNSTYYVFYKYDNYNNRCIYFWSGSSKIIVDLLRNHIEDSWRLCSEQCWFHTVPFLYPSVNSFSCLIFFVIHSLRVPCKIILKL